MKEYEYSFKVKSIKPFIGYCKEKGYEKVSEVTQNRIVYENKHTEDIIARITKRIIDGDEKAVFDIKNVGTRNENLKDSTESIPLTITEENTNIIYSMLGVQDFYEVANNYRTRYIYVKNGVKFEIDDYIRPKMQVIGIEGNKDVVDTIYNEIIQNKIGNILKDE